MDGRAARQWLSERGNIDHDQIVLMGRSLGGAVAVDLAADGGARGLILQSTFSSMPDTAAALYPWLPVRWLLRTQLNSMEKIGSYHGPLLQSHGKSDRIIPFELGQKLHDAANEPKQIFLIEGMGHNAFESAAYFGALERFLKDISNR